MKTNKNLFIILIFTLIFYSYSQNIIGNETIENLSVDSQEKMESKLSIFGIWHLDKIVMISELYDDVDFSGYKDLIGKEEEYIGRTIEFTKNSIKIGDIVIKTPIYTIEETNLGKYKRGGKLHIPTPYEVIKNEKIYISGSENYKYLGEVPIEVISVEYNEYIIYGNYCLMLNENKMFLGQGGKIMLATRIK